MTIEDLQKICKQYKGVTEDIKWEDHLCFNVGGKMFLVTSPDSFPVTASFKVADEKYEELIALEGFSPAPYLARYKWVFLDDINLLHAADWEQYIAQSYKSIARKLPAKTRKEISFSD